MNASLGGGNSDVRARHLLKTAKRANEAGNFKREAALLEEAMVLASDVSAHTLRRYCSALYKVGEYRAAAMVAYDSRMDEGDNLGFVERLRANLEERGVKSFLDVIERCDI